MKAASIVSCPASILVIWELERYALRCGLLFATTGRLAQAAIVGLALFRIEKDHLGLTDLVQQRLALLGIGAGLVGPDMARLAKSSLLDDLRAHPGTDTALGLPPGPNSGLSVCLAS